MSRMFLKFSIAGALVASALTGASSASAVWTTNGNATGVTFVGTAGPRTLSVDASGAGGAQGITCAGGSIAGVLFGSSASGVPLATIFGPTTSGCSVVGQPMAVKCAVGTLNGVSYSSATNVATGFGTLVGTACVAVKTSGACGNATTFSGGGITFSGSGLGTYGNTSQQVTVPTTGQTIDVSWNSSGCLQGTGTGSARGTLGAEVVYSVTSAFKPQISN